jgi:toxin-antitoxin system PIN domain toxin
LILLDVNVLVYAHREDTRDHEAFRTWLEDVVNSPHAYGVSDLVLSGFVRVVTHPRVFDPPSTLETALEFVEQVRSSPSCVVLAPGPRHWQIFTDLCRKSGVKGNLVPDAYLAALAIETGSEWVTTDRGFSRFPNLKWRHPLSGA